MIHEAACAVSRSSGTRLSDSQRDRVPSAPISVSLMPMFSPNTSRSSLDDTALSSTPRSMSLPPTTNNLDDKDKQRLLRQARKLSQIFGELPQEIITPSLARSGSPAAEVPSAHSSHLQIASSRNSFIDPSTHPFCFPAPMSPQHPPSVRDTSCRNSSVRWSPALFPLNNIQRDLPRFGFGSLRRAASTTSLRPNEDVPHAKHLPSGTKMPFRSSSVRLLNRMHLARTRDSSRRQSVNNPVLLESHAHPQRSEDFSTPVHPQHRSVSLLSKRRNTKGVHVQQWHFTAESQEDAALTEAYPPLTKEQKTQSLRRGRKLAQLFGAEPPTALYKMTSCLEGVPTTPSTPQSVQRERMKTYVAFSSSDLLSICTGQSSRRHSESHSTLSSISISSPFSDATNEVDLSQESDSNPTLTHQFTDSDEDSNPTAHNPFEESSDSTTSRRRRLRADKLARFFGVNYDDLSCSTAVTAPKSRIASDIGSVVPAGVGVKIQERGWFWKRADAGSHSRIDAQDADMNDVIKRLRQMPRA